ncbi:hypothetical protein TNCT_25081 [Trichonephila clavata]|uniref:Uncharacterized protein n=1 Tax=Trichonephila clavata TaxID=2740835 RepID=A0A8X6F689_TRICU|nr:hypothetical protein TNCT_25081 [Trichonephila clavata]
MYAGKHTIEIATFIAVWICNEGFIPILKILTLMGIKIAPEAHTFDVKLDNIRVERSEIRASDASKEVRNAPLELRKIRFLK